jgi:hypothetical protein
MGLHSGYTALAVSLLPSHVVQYIYARPDPSDPNALVVSNLPVDSTLEDIKAALAPLQPLSVATLDPASALATAESSQHRFNVSQLFRNSAARVLSPQSQVRVQLGASARAALERRPSDPLPWPVAGTRNTYELARPSLESVRKHTDQWMDAFDQPTPTAAPVASSNKRKAAAVEDNEWTVVAKGVKGRSAPTSTKQSVSIAGKSFLKEQASLAHGIEPAGKRRKSKSMPDDFYVSKKDEKRKQGEFSGMT